jgi:hypothetical protein
MKKTLIERIEVGSGGAASITFSSIPQSYTDLLLVLSARTTYASTSDFLNIYPNGNTSNLTQRRLSGSGDSATSGTATRNYINANSATASTFGNLQFYLPNYAGSNAKSISTDAVTENNAANAYAIIEATLWNDTTAISSIELDPVYGNFVQYTTASLYGITAGNDGITTVS